MEKKKKTAKLTHKFHYFIDFSLEMKRTCLNWLAMVVRVVALLSCVNYVTINCTILIV